jgi:hypothetical protein
MISKTTYASLRDRATGLLMSRGYELMPPSDVKFLTRPVPLHLIGLRGDCDALWVKLKVAYRSVSVVYIESFCVYEICQFRAFMTAYSGDLFLRCEVWIVSPTGAIHCYEVLPSEIREVAAYGR